MNEVHWRELKHEVVDTGLCTGCAACVMACPRDVLGYTQDHLPVQIGEGMAHDQCVIGDRGCDICTRACPRFRAWETDLDQELFGRPRREDEVYGQVRSILLARTTDAGIAAVGQDGGLVSSLLVWGLEHDLIDGALASSVEDVGRGPFDAAPALVTDRAGVLATAGSRYTYAAPPLAMAEAEEAGLKRLALVGMSCQASINGSLPARGVRKYERKIALTIGLLCSKTFTYEGQEQVLADHGIAMQDVTKINIKGRYQVWTRDGAYHEIPLKLFHPHTRPGCKMCPDFAAQHADISTGGIGADDNWTLALIRTARGEEWMKGVIDAGLVEVRPGEDDEVAMNLLTKLSTVSRRRWPSELVPDGARAPGMLPIV
ncbi:MAG: Coenzyme F420 hydrogenase/dehydrogenase, beta subunit C-terminal domain [Nitriliruptoraceae bacterium]|nr:Coenzyme F420 hydrogenase/dehydrogenase, beta subunit C-terminal domain [Nitriliruptoraceae bacterium]